jgi:hypothetical protein
MRVHPAGTVAYPAPLWVRNMTIMSSSMVPVGFEMVREVVPFAVEPTARVAHPAEVAITVQYN